MGRGTLRFNGVTGGSSDPGFPCAAPRDFNGLFGDAGRRGDDDDESASDRTDPAHQLSAQTGPTSL